MNTPQAAAVDPPRSLSRWPKGDAIRRALAAYTFLLPALGLLALFTLVPIVYALYMAVHKVNIMSGEYTFNGFKNLGYLFSDRKFWAACANTFRYVIVVVPLQTAFALALACLLNGRIKFKRGFITLLFLPTLTSSAAMTMIFMWLFNNNGLVTGLLSETFDIQIKFLSDPAWALAVIMLMNVFSTVPHFMVVYLAGLQEIPKNLYEAATLDGASTWTQHMAITVPQLTPITFYVITMGLIGCFQVFDQAFILSGGEGGPENSTLTFTLLIYQFAFKSYNTMGIAAALAVVLTAIIFLATLLLNRFVKQDGNNG